MRRTTALSYLLSLLSLIIMSACSQVSAPDVPRPQASLAGSIPPTLTLYAGPDEVETTTLGFRNAGDADLSYQLLNSATWLKLDSLEGSLKPGQETSVGLAASCLSAQDQRSSITLKSNDPDSPEQHIVVKLVCSTQPYQIDLAFVGSVSASRRAIFEAAAERWSRMIVRDLVDVDLSKPSNACGMEEPAVNQTIDDLMIHVVIDTIDGEGGILGAAGPCYLRGTGAFAPFYGVMRFDSADISALEQSGSLEGVILHEMGHVLGIGTLWDYLSHLEYQTSPAGQVCNRASGFSKRPTFKGSRASAEYARLGGAGQPQVEDNYGSGTKCGHWDEEIFGHELMTGFTGPGLDLPLSRLSAASLADLGYEVDLSQADPYRIPDCAPNCLATQSLHVHEQLLYPRAKLGPDGQLEALEPLDP